jgi:hypothetical protein
MSKAENKQTPQTADLSPASCSAGVYLLGVFRALRFSKDHHKGLGDIQISVGKQEEIAEKIDEFLKQNGEVSDGSQPPMPLNLSVSEADDSLSLHRLVGCAPGLCGALFSCLDVPDWVLSKANPHNLDIVSNSQSRARHWQLIPSVSWISFRQELPAPCEAQLYNFGSSGLE